MKTSYPRFKPLLVTVAAIASASAFLLGTAVAASHKHGTDILHFFSRTAMTNEGVSTNATGSVEASHDRQGHSDHQQLGLRLKGLDASASYQLLAAVGDDTNLVEVAGFNSDSKGRASLLYRDFGNGKKLGHGRAALPAALNPVTGIRELAIFNSDTQAVLTAQLDAPDKLQYLIKRDLGTNNIDATLRIKATTTQTQFRLDAKGLSASSDYLLALNGGVVQTNATDAKGRLAIRSLLENPGDILDIQTVSLWDSASNVVLTTTLP